MNELLVRQFNHDLPENPYDKTEASQEDPRFIQIMDSAADLKDGHSQSPPPFKRSDPQMPNSRQMAEQRAASLKRKFSKN